jgi:hypothetical protein
MSQAGIINVNGGGGGGSPIETITGNDGIATSPTANNINLVGLTVANATNAVPVYVKQTATSTDSIEVQVANAAASTSINNAGLSSFNSVDFTVDANGFVSLANSTAFAYTNVTFAMSPYTVLSTDYYISVDSSGGAITIILPNSTTLYREIIVKDRTGNASEEVISVTTVGGVILIDDETIYEIDGNFNSIDVLWNGTSYETF